MTQEIGYAVVLADQLDKGRTLSVQFNFAKGTTAAQMNEEVDKLVSVMARQRAKAQVPELEQYIKAQELVLGNLEQDVIRGNERLAKLSEHDPQRRNQSNAEAKSLADALEKQKIMIEDVRKKVAAGKEELEDLRKKAA